MKNLVRSALILFLCNIFYTIKCQNICNVQANQTLCDANNQDFNLTQELSRISSSLDESEKVLELLEVRNANIEELGENAFLDLGFLNIKIFNANNLSRIHTNAFSDKIITNLIHEFLIDNPSSLENNPPDYDLFKALNSLTNAADIELSLKELEIHEIPDNAFSQTQNNLHYLVFAANAVTGISGYGMSRIGSNSFSGLSQITSISLRHIDIQSISSDAFNINESSDQKLTINLESCMLLDTSLENNSFTGANRPVNVVLDGNSIDFIREETFKAFLNENPQNSLQFHGSPMDCGDIESFLWLLNDKANYQNRILGALCYDGTSIWDIDINGTSTPSSVSSTVGTDYVYKCVVESNLTRCNANNQDFNLTQELLKISNELDDSEKVMLSLEIQNSNIEELPENAFLDLAFDNIKIYNANNLARIHTNALSDKVKANLLNEFLIDNPSSLENNPPDYDLFKALNSLRNADDIELSLKELELHEIPDNAFSEPQNLLYLDFIANPVSGTSGYGLSRIGSKSFGGLSQITQISLRQIEILSISSDAFNIIGTSGQTLKIDLTNCMLSEHSLENNSFTGANRPVNVVLDGNSIDFIREETFKAFLNENPQNSLSFNGNPMDCEDIDTFLWLLNDRDNYQNRVIGALCYDGTPIWDWNVNGTTTPSSVSSTVNPDYQYKCVVESNLTRCNANNQDFDLTQELLKISNDLDDSQKVMLSLEIQNSNIEELPENAFLDLAFDNIKIYNANKLARIHTNAFSDKVKANLLNEFLIDNPSSLENNPPDYDLFKALNSLRNAADMELSLKELEFHEIPDNAFSKPQNLLYLDFVVNALTNTSGYGLSRIGSKSFAGLSQIIQISLRGIDILSISSDAFNIIGTSDQTLKIDLTSCVLVDRSFGNNSFTGANRPVNVVLDGNEIDFIREEKFKAFLNENPQNSLSFNGNPMDCEDIDTFLWLLNDRDNYQNRVRGALCYDGTPIWDWNINGTSSTATGSPGTSPPTTPGNSLAIKPSFLLILIFLISFVLINLK